MAEIKFIEAPVYDKGILKIAKEFELMIDEMFRVSEEFLGSSGHSMAREICGVGYHF